MRKWSFIYIHYSHIHEIDLFNFFNIEKFLSKICTKVETLSKSFVILPRQIQVVCALNWKRNWSLLNVSFPSNASIGNSPCIMPMHDSSYPDIVTIISTNWSGTRHFSRRIMHGGNRERSLHITVHKIIRASVRYAGTIATAISTPW